MSKVLTGCIIRLSVTPRGGVNTVIGAAMALDVQESYGVRPTYGIGRLTAFELPILQYSGACSLQSYAIDTNATQNILNQFQRQGTAAVPDLTTWVNQILTSEGVDITIIMKQKVNGVIVDNTVAKISGATCTSEAMQINENQIVMRSGSFIFAAPIKV